MHASTKAGTVGAGLIYVAVAVYFSDVVVVSLSGLTVLFLLATAPVAAHAIARTAYRMRVPLSPRTHLDQWTGQYAPMDASEDAAGQQTRSSSGSPS